MEKSKLVFVLQNFSKPNAYEEVRIGNTMTSVAEASI